MYSPHFSKKGMTLVETLIAVAVFLVIVVGIYEGYIGIIKLLAQTRYRVAATLIANEKIEIVRNMRYEDVGILGGLPAGEIPGTQTVTRDGVVFMVIATTRNIDDPFDGQIGGTPNDTAPADYKLVQFIVSCDACRDFSPLSFTTTVAPKNLEIASGNGALFIEVVDANGEPVQDAAVHVVNSATTTPITIDDVTNAQGLLQLVDVPPGVQTYQITVSKGGYSSAQTYTPGAVGNPNPTKPHATVAAGLVTQVSLSIDKVSTLAIRSTNVTCAAIPSVDFNLSGQKLIGTGPTVYKYDQNLQTNGSGLRNLTTMEWDTYTPTITSGSYQLAGTIPFVPFLLAPNGIQELLLIMQANNPDALLVSVKDAGTGLPISDAQVTITAGAFNSTKITTRGYLRQTDWSGGGAQSDFTDEARYFDSDGNVAVDDPAGDVVLKTVSGEYVSNGYLESSTFNTGASTTIFYSIDWSPTDQAPETEANSVRFQIATNNDNATWNYIGPDGTAGSYYTLSNTNIATAANNNQYLRYKMYLQTASTTFTPRVAEVSITFGSLCVPFGQVFFNGLSPATYTVNVSKTGYAPYSQDVVVGDAWQSYEVLLNPE